VSLLERAVACARACPGLERVVVSTDDEEIAEAARRSGAEVPFLRPSSLARDETPKWEVFRHLVHVLEESAGTPVNILVDLDVTVAGRSPEDVAACLDLLCRPGVEVAITAYQGRGNPYYNMVEVGAEGLASIVKRPPVPVQDRQSAPVVYSLSPAVFAIRAEALALREHWSTANIAVHVIPRGRAWDIDDEVDLEFVDFLLRRDQG
jgi:CMP-N-acetylneuraminic acid synthetase